MIKLQITAFIAVFFMTVSMMILPVQTEQELQRERQDYAAKLLKLKEEQADLEVKRIADAYARMSDEERLRGDAEAHKNY
ncbi:MAG: hypothetical protein J6589_09540 [Snodgrassella sp.]|uniref:hypothetical protein n=1 Tax=Snodgrassella sp. TaxID=2815304 RepID=UPI00258C389E|nr:hypothetical protein [Snodgrassella sp.]MCO6514690.1 hypothetical protein [Snodgrassella sp.]MCO6520512.1 hypothetical protein [Snodgrassella sp.]